LVHLFVGRYNGVVKPDPLEVDQFSWLTYEFLSLDVSSNPEKYTYWFRHYLSEFGRNLFLIQKS